MYEIPRLCGHHTHSVINYSIVCVFYFKSQWCFVEGNVACSRLTCPPVRLARYIPWLGPSIWYLGQSDQLSFSSKQQQHQYQLCEGHGFQLLLPPTSNPAFTTWAQPPPNSQSSNTIYQIYIIISSNIYDASWQEDVNSAGFSTLKSCKSLRI